MTLHEILTAIETKHGENADISFLAARMMDGDFTGRKQLADLISTQAAKLSPGMIYEISKWGINDDMSQLAEIRSAP
jgi:hypothetical protein